MGSRHRRIWGYVSAVLFLSAAAGPLLVEAGIRRPALMTVTDTSAVLTWETNEPANTIVRYGTKQDKLDQTASSGGTFTRYHHCEIRGLEPGTKYFYVCRSGPAKLAVGPMSPGRFKTLVPPPGKELFSFATMTDMHVGQTNIGRFSVRGKLVNKGVVWRDSKTPFWEMSVGAAIDEINAHNVALTIIKGDITDHSYPSEFAKARRLLNRLTKPYYVVRGNHDHGLRIFLRTFALPKSWYSFDYQGYHFVVLDTEPFAKGMSPELTEQLAWLSADFEKNSGRRTFVSLHRPVPPNVERRSNGLGKSLYGLGKRVLQGRFGNSATHMLDRATGRTPNIRPESAIELAKLLRKHGRVVGVLTGHLHRNFVGYWPEQTGNLPYIETASTKEYPCGYAVTRVYEGGYMQNYFTPGRAECLKWSAMTQDAYTKIGYGSKVGSLKDRNFVILFEELDLTPKIKSVSGP